MYDISWPKLTTCEVNRLQVGDVIYGRGEFITQTNTVENFELFREPLIIKHIIPYRGDGFRFEGNGPANAAEVTRLFSGSSFAIIEDRRKMIRGSNVV